MAGLTLLVLIAAQAAAPEAQCPASPAWRSVISDHVERYPGMEPADLYKLLHQGATGSEHAVENAATARRWMDEEVESLGEGPGEPMVDVIAPGRALVRIHLRPFVAAGGDLEALLAAFVETANSHRATATDLTCALEVATGLAAERLLPWGADELGAYFDRMRTAGYPAVHHSDAFASSYRPAYRVVAGSLVAGLLPSGN